MQIVPMLGYMPLLASPPITDINRIIGGHIRRLRKATLMPNGRAMTTVDLALELGMNNGNISRIERGEIPISMENLAKVAAYFKRPIPYFFTMGVEEEVDAPITLDGDHYAPVLESHEIPEWLAKRRIDSRKVFDITKVIRTKVTNPRAFAYTVTDDSMSPLYHRGDVLVFNPDREPRPQKTVMAVTSKGLIVVGQYKERGYSDVGTKLFDVIPLNKFFGEYSSDRDGLVILGTWAELRRYDDDEIQDARKTAIQ